tara:strand:+ start:404 stop:1045 length:642 start_codon:yes stop_codon:yes gene_type:complete
MTLIKKYFPQISDSQIMKLSTFEKLIREWNKKINLVSRKDVENFQINHVIHSLSISKLIFFKPKTKILDIGTGGGLPGIPLAIIFPEAEFHLVDRKKKKMDVLVDIIKKLDLNNVKIEACDAKDILDKYDFILNRAVSSTENILSICKNKLSIENFNKIENGIICLKGGDLKRELINIKDFDIIKLNEIFSEPFFETKKILYIPSPYIHRDNV